jgi:hypothetical protein
VGAGFDNNYDLVPDRNIWIQPIGDSSSYDPGCFRLVKTYGLVIVKLNDGTELLIPFVDQLYFENIPDNNTGAVGLVFYEYIALDGICTAGLTPYQEVASGYDNEKFNADFGAGIPPLQSRESNMTIDKTGQTTIGLSGTINYSMTFTLPDVESGDTTTTITVGNPSNGLPLTFYETVPSGLEFISNSASTSVTMTNYASPQAATVLASKDSGATWYNLGVAADQTAFCSPSAWPCNKASTSPNNLVIIQWQLANGITSPTSNPAVTGTVAFNAFVPGAYTGKIVSNTSCMKLGNGPCFVEDTHNTLISGNYSISGSVFCDDGPATGGAPCNTGSTSGVSGSAWRENGMDEPGMGSISVSLYYDANNDNQVDAGDTILSTVTTTRYNVFDGYIDMDNDANATVPDTGDDGTLLGYTIIDGAIDINNSGTITTADDGFFAGFLVIDGRLDTNRSGTITIADDGTIAPYYFSSLPGSTNYVVKVDTADADIPAGYTNTTPAQRSADIAAANVTDVDFAFGPALTLVKRLDSPARTIVGQTAIIQYTLRVTNNIPGGGSANNYCQYNVWASKANQSGGNPPGGGPANAQFQSVNLALGAPDELFAYTDIGNTTNELGLEGFSIGNMGGNITNVKFVASTHERTELTAQNGLGVVIYYDGDNDGTSTATTDTFRYNGDGTISGYATQTGVFQSPLGTEYIITETLNLTRVTGRSSGGWLWSDFGAGKMEAQILGYKSASGAGNFNLDGFGFQIITDQICNDPGQIINPLPVTDTFESYYMSFVSANPPISSQNTTGSGTGALTTLVWDNIGPLYPGQSKEIVVLFHADQITAGNTYLTLDKADNTAVVDNAKFGNGRDTNDVTANTPVEIVAPRTVSGTVWYDIDGDGWQGANGYEASPTDGKIPNVKVTLYGCVDSGGYFLVDTGTNITGNDQCSEVGGTWFAYATALSSEYKIVDGLLDVNKDGSVTTADDGSALGCTVTDGVLSGCTTFNGVPVIGGYIDVDRDGSTNPDTGDDLEIGDYRFTGLY